jgi:hypothetical protein
MGGRSMILDGLRLRDLLTLAIAAAWAIWEM